MTMPDEIWELPSKHIGRRVHIYNSLPSTNDIAAELPAGDGTVIIAREQTAGRGQYGRSWHSNAGQGVWSSTALTPSPALARPVLLIAWSAIAVCEALRSYGVCDATIKWPNDVLVKGRKVSGVLIEQRKHTIVGIGLNVNQTASDFATAELPDATSLALLLGRSFGIDEVAWELIRGLDREYERVLNGEVAGLQSRWQYGLGLVGQEVVVELHGGDRANGVLHEITFDQFTLKDADGTLRMFLPEKVRQIALQ
jgi:BirA family biotin operon repressor/biotin-[acetyl-CoA-carboxylase] ligase